MRKKIISIIMVLLIILSFVPEGLVIKTKGNTNPILAITDFNVNKDTPQVIGKEITLTTKAEGIGKLKYRFVAYSGTYKEVIQDFSDSNEVKWKPSKAGVYNLYFVAKDESGKTVTKVINNYDIKENLNLQINKYTTDKVSPQNINTPIKLSSEGVGTGKLKYRFVAYSGTYKEVIQDFSDNNEVQWIPSKAGTYNLYFVIKDDVGKTVTKSITNYIINDNKLEIKSFGADKLSPQKVGSKIQLTTKAQGNGEIKYRFVAVLDGITEVVQDFNANNTVTWTPKKSGKYNIYFVAKDSLGERVQKAIYGYEVQEDLNISSANVSLLSPQELGSKINLTTIAKGNGPLEYRFVAVSGDYKEIIKDYSSNNSVTWTPTKAGIYNLYFVVKDSTGRSINKVLKYEVLNPISIKNISTSKTSPQEIGTEININTEVVGDGKILYRFSYKKDSQVVYLSDFTESNKISWIPNVKGNYTIVAEAKGPTQKIVKKEIPFEIKEATVDREKIILEDSIVAKTINKPVNIWLNDNSIISLKEYKLQYSEKDKDNFTTISEGTNLSNNSLIGTFDTTLLQNGLYDIKLIGIDNSGNKIEKNAVYLITGNLKAGNFKFSNEDLNIPLDGLPISIVRSYNSAQNYSGDFGNGFSLSLTNLKLQVTDDIGETGWEQIKTGSGILSTVYEIRETKEHKVTITYPDGETEEFGVKLSPQKQKLQPIQYTEMYFEAKSGSTSKLRSLDNVEFNVFGGYLLSDEFGYSPSNFELTDKNGIKYIINKNTGVNKIIYLDGETVSINKNEIIYTSSDNTIAKTVNFERDSKNRITSIKDFDDKRINYTYDDKGNLVSVIDRQGRETKYIYDTNNKLVQIKSPYNETPARYEYDSNGRLIAYIDEYDIRTEYIFKEGTKEYIVKDAAGNLQIYEYDNNGNVVVYTDKENNKTYFEYNSSNKLIKETDPLGNVFKYNYDEYGNLLSKEDPYGNKVEGTYNEYGEALTIKDSNNNILVSNTYGNGGILTEVKDVNNQSVNIEYNSNDKPIKFTNQLGKVVQVAYDSNNNPISYKDEMGNITKFTYDDNGNCLSKSMEVTIDGKREIITVSYEYDASGNIVKSTDSKGNISLYEYSKNTNKLTKATDKKGNITKYQYDDNGNLAKIIYPDNTEENMTYDKMKNMTSVIDENGQPTYFKYDKMSRLTEITYPNGLVIKYTYDAKGNIIKVSDSLGKEIKYVYDALSRNTEIIDSLNNKTSFKYDTSSNLVNIIYSNGNTICYEYDKLGRNTKITYGDNLSKSYVYDSIGRITEAINEEGNSTYYKYDDCSNLIKVIDPLGNSTSYEYNEAGLLIKEIDANLNATEYRYDTLGRIIERKLPLGQKESYEYDNNGNVTKITDFNGKVTLFEYNSINQLIKKTLADGSTINYYYNNGYLKEVKDNTGFILYEYDQIGNLKKQTNVNGESIEYTYDLYGNKAIVKTANSNISYGYDKIGRLIWTRDKNGIQTTYEYDNVGNLIKENKGNGTYTTYKYNSANRLIKLENKKSNGEIISTYEYTYNKVGFRTSVKDNTGKITNYVYDKSGNLLSESSSGTTVNYEYDKVYNRIKKTTGTEVINYSYDKNNRLLKEGDISYTYDNNGNLTKKENTKIKEIYTYNLEDKLTKAIISKDGVIGEEKYYYNPLGTRIKKITNGEVTNYLVDENSIYTNVLEEKDSNNKLKAYYIYGNDLIKQNRNGEDYYYNRDGLGSTVSISNKSGQVVENYIYDAFGNLKSNNKLENNYLYAGEEQDKTTGFYNLRARYMDPKTGRFISQDKYLGTIEEPITLHKYLYANSNPVNYIDPSGYSSGTLIDQEATMEVQGNLNGIALIKYNVRALYARLNSSLVGKYIKEVSINVIESSLDGELTGEEVAGSFVESVFTSGVSKHLRYKCFNTNSALVSKGIRTSEVGESLTSIYRAVGPDEFYNVMKVREFSVIPNGLQAKQFGLSFKETLKFAEKYSDIGAVIEVKLPTKMLNKIGDFTQVDRFIFKGGTVTIQANKLVEFNKAIKQIIHKY